LNKDKAIPSLTITIITNSFSRIAFLFPESTIFKEKLAAYNKYQKCGIKAAGRLLVTGF
jgi:hypothetical protein